MYLWQQHIDSFVKVYQPLAANFLKEIGETKVAGMPEPFFPVAGRNYPTAACKIVFAGMETRGWGEMEDFVTDARESGAKAVLREQNRFDTFEFTKWPNNFGSDFWSFVLKFLAGFHDIADWKELKQRKHADILSSFAWANLNAVERYQVTAEWRGVKLEDWSTVKKASSPIDRGDNVLRALTPHLVVITNWTPDESWLTEHRSVAERTTVADHLLYMRLQPCGTHVIWTAHPTWLSKHPPFDDWVTRCVKLAKEKLIHTI